MKQLFFLLMLLFPGSAEAREAVLEIFIAEQHPGFAVLVPGLTASWERTEERTQLPIAPSDAIPSPSDGMSDQPSAVRPAVPNWMRAAVPARSQARSAPYLSDPACRDEMLLPPAGLGPEAQIRRSAQFRHIVQVACEAGVPVRLFDALIAQESRYRPFARSSAGAMGLAQLMPATARELGVENPWDPLQNLRGGARYLRNQIDRFGTWELALAAYNAGPARVVRYGGIPPFSETRTYVRTVMASIRARRPHLHPNMPAGILTTYPDASDIPELPEANVPGKIDAYR